MSSPCEGFSEWWESQQMRFHCGQANDTEMAEAAWYEGGKRGSRELAREIVREVDNTKSDYVTLEWLEQWLREKGLGKESDAE